jgi:hypothetical protein
MSHVIQNFSAEPEKSWPRRILGEPQIADITLR